MLSSTTQILFCKIYNCLIEVFNTFGVLCDNISNGLFVRSLVFYFCKYSTLICQALHAVFICLCRLFFVKFLSFLSCFLNCCELFVCQFGLCKVRDDVYCVTQCMFIKDYVRSYFVECVQFVWGKWLFSTIYYTRLKRSIKLTRRDNCR